MAATITARDTRSARGAQRSCAPDRRNRHCPSPSIDQPGSWMDHREWTTAPSAPRTLSRHCSAARMLTIQAWVGAKGRAAGASEEQTVAGCRYKLVGITSFNSLRPQRDPRKPTGRPEKLQITPAATAQWDSREQLCHGGAPQKACPTSISTATASRVVRRSVGPDRSQRTQDSGDELGQRQVSGNREQMRA